MPAQDLGSVGGFESPFEQAVAEQLAQRGWTVVPQVGISGFRIDLGVRHPDLAGAYLAGVECDGATYHSAAMARDRDKVREQVLTGLGWNILRVWSTDWWFDAVGCSSRLHDQLDALLADSRARNADAPGVTAHWDMGHEVEQIEEIRDDEAAAAVDAVAPAPAIGVAELVSAEVSPIPADTASSSSAEVAAPPGDETPKRYRITDLTAFQIDPGRFFEFGYRDTLRSMIGAVIEVDPEGEVLASNVNSTRQSSSAAIHEKGAQAPRIA